MMGKKAAVVTGAGTGIGREVVLKLIGRGMKVYAVGIDLEPLQELARECEKKGAAVVPVQADVADGAALKKALSNTGPVQVIVANAGICKQAALDDPNTDQVWREVMSINLDGVWNTFRALCGSIEENGRAVVVSSGLGKLGRSGYGAYTASKHAVLGLVKCFSKELASRKITVNAVCPGWVDTQMSAGDIIRTAKELGSTPEQVRQDALAGIPLGRFVRPEEVAALIEWLASENASAITGQAYNISCGEFFA
jgi:NAD(P)-dependent dehydrogenase (short-subunit alcohol dehydrogenase family)